MSKAILVAPRAPESLNGYSGPILLAASFALQFLTWWRR
jgi:hypothetical protein